MQAFALSRQQERLWSWKQDGVAQCAIQIEGELDRDVLRRAISAIADHYEILRTVFYRQPGLKSPFQVILPDAEIAWQDVDLTAEPAVKQAITVADALVVARQSLRDLDKPPLLSLTSFALTSHKHVLLVTLPALCADYQSLITLVTEIGRFYAAELDGKAIDNEPLQYVDFSEWQREQLESDDEEAAGGRAYWQQHDVSTYSPLPLIGGPATGFAPETCGFTLSSDLYARLLETAHAYEVPVFAFLLACWQVLLSRLTGEPDVVILQACDGRSSAGIQDVVGLFTNWVPVHAHLEDAVPFDSALLQAARTVDDACKWQEYFDGNTTGWPAAFSWEEVPPVVEAANVALSVSSRYLHTHPFALKLTGVDTGQILQLEIQYNSARFDAADGQRLSDQLHTLLAAALDAPGTPLRDLNLLSAAARDEAVYTFNQTQRPYPQDTSVHQLFAEQAKRTPAQTALVFEDTSLTYQELNRRANQLAHHLRKRGIGPETHVALYLERGVEIMVAILGTLKAGGAYVPLDYNVPQERLNFMLQTVQARVVLTQAKIAPSLPPCDAEIIHLDSDWALIAEEDDGDIVAGYPEALAYILFTSGSTGRPKGVAVEHRQLLNYVRAVSDRLNVPAGGHFATVSAFTADLGNTAIYPAICTGGCLHIISLERASDPEAFAAYMAQWQIDCLKIVPSHLQALLTAAQPEQTLPRQCLVLGGEVCHWNLVERIWSLAPHCRIINHYGPTETTVGVATHERHVGDNIRSATVPIGTPIANTQIYLLDTRLRPVPAGAPGELYIGGSNLTRGYLARPGQTAVSYVPNPFPQTNVTRLYKTGDIGRRLSDGCIEFLGRADYQVKIRGYRIETAEIELVLRQHPGVDSAVVTAVEDKNGEKRLAAYYTLQPSYQPIPSNADLRRCLLDKLPEQMVPSILIRLDALPLMPNGKVDRRALPELDQFKPNATESFVPPRNPVEHEIAAVWRDVLGLPQVGVLDNFFALGGDSILCIRIIARLNQAGYSLALKDIFQHQTVAELATLTDAATVTGREPGTGPVPMTPAQRHLLWHWPSPYNVAQAVWLETPEPLNPSWLRECVHQLLLHHDVLRLRLDPDSGQLTFTTLTNDVPFHVVDAPLVGLPDAVLSEQQVSLIDGPLLRVILFRLYPSQADRLLILLHQAVADTETWQILLTDLQHLYQQLSQGSPLQLPPTTTAFRTWAERLGAGMPAHLNTDAHAAAPPTLFQMEAAVQQALISLDEATTALVCQRILPAYNIDFPELLLTALVDASAERLLMVELTDDARQHRVPGIKLHRTAGNFGIPCTVSLTLPDADPAEKVRVIKEQVRHVPAQGLDYSLQYFLAQDAQPVQRHVCFHWQEPLTLPDDSVFHLGVPFPDLPTAPAVPSTLTGRIENGCLQVKWMSRDSEVDELAVEFRHSLQTLIDYGLSIPDRALAPSDFPLAELSQHELDAILRKIGLEEQ